MSDLKPGLEHARLTTMAGTWDVVATFWFQPGGEPFVAKGRSTITAFSGLFIEERLESSMGKLPFRTLSLTGYNTFTKQYEATRIASTNTIQIHETGHYDGREKRFVLDGEYLFLGETWRQRSIIRHPVEDLIEVDVHMSHGDVPEWLGCSLRHTRRA